jgi:hypothetical protein
LRGFIGCRYFIKEGSVKYAVEMISGGMMYVPGFMNIGTGVQTLLRGSARTGRSSHKLMKIG